MTDLLKSGIYGITEAALLLDVPPARLRGWVTGYYHQKSDPIIKSDIEPVDHSIALSFVNLIEARFVHAFASLGVDVRSIRYMAKEARRILGHEHPFASELMFKTDGQSIYMITAEKTKNKRFYDLKRHNFSLGDIVKNALKKDVVYGPTGLAQAWYPRKRLAPNVAIHPNVAFGQPAIDEAGVPTQALYQSYLAEGKDVDRVAEWYEVPAAWVNQAVKFEIRLNRPS